MTRVYPPIASTESSAHTASVAPRTVTNSYSLRRHRFRSEATRSRSRLRTGRPELTAKLTDPSNPPLPRWWDGRVWSAVQEAQPAQAGPPFDQPTSYPPPSGSPAPGHPAYGYPHAGFLP